LTEKKAQLKIGAKIACPNTTFFKALAMSVLGIALDMMLNHMCSPGADKNMPMPNILNVRILSQSSFAPESGALQLAMLC
jgi:hypothetical protein